MLGTFAGALAARGIAGDEGRASCTVDGEIESEEGVLVIRRIHVSFVIAAEEEKRETIERVHGVFAMQCPVYRSLRAGIQITSSWELRAA
ncbi:MAG TPA: OsmC family protein [Candidatus Acidoferrales bacterium]|nr:OsmC family protein [Candidatus Acidoferrales bacterium]